jgi:type IV pilus assembly protein PilY1
MNNTPLIAYPSLPAGVTGQPKDYFFDGSVGLYETFKKDAVTGKDLVPFQSDKAWIFPAMRRGGRMLYAFDVSAPGNPVLKWVNGCPNMGNDTGCTAGMSGLGQTWSVPSVGFIKGYSSGTAPVVFVGGGYDSCEDTDSKTTSCTNTTKGNHVYIINADTGTVLRTFDTDRSVPADVTLIDGDFDGAADFVYIVDSGGAVYRIDLVDPATMTPRASGAWTITKIAATTGSSRKFQFGPAALATVNPLQVFLALGTGDRERPLISNYPYDKSVQNRFYMFIDRFPASGTVDLDGSTMSDFSSTTGCDTMLDAAKNGWFMDLPDRGEQTVTSSVIFGGTVFFSTNRPVPTPPNSCDTNLGEARGYAVNLLNASGVIGTGGLCGGDRSGTFTGGGLPPSPVVGTVPVVQADGTTKSISVLIGGINLDTGTGSPIGAQQPPVPIKAIRSRVYWYPHGDK